jgi:hypothetical protein
MRKTEKGSRPRRVTETQIAALGGRLTDRDRLLALDCYEHQVLTTEQLQRLWFPSVRAARYRLQALYSLRVLDHVRPVLKRGEGSAPYHWILDEAGAYVVAAEQGIERREVRWRHSHALTVAASPSLTHRIETNEFFTRLAQDARAAHGTLSEWYGERTTHTMLDGIAKPDGYGVLTLPDSAPIHVLLELDRGTETIDRLRDKGARYARAIPRGALRHSNPLVLLAVPTAARAQNATAAVTPTGASIAVVVWTAKSTTSPLASILTAQSQIEVNAREVYT